MNECSTLNLLYKRLLKSPADPTKCPKTQTGASVTFQRRGFPHLRPIKLRCSSLAGRAGSKYTGETEK